MCNENRWFCFECNASKSWRYSCELFPDRLISTSLITYNQVVRLGYIWSMAASCNSFMFKWKIPSSAPISKYWSRVSGCIQEAVQWILNGQPLNIFEKQAPICTFGVGGKPFETGRGGVWRLRCDRLGGTGGVLFNKSGGVSLSKNKTHANVKLFRCYFVYSNDKPSSCPSLRLRSLDLPISRSRPTNWSLELCLRGDGSSMPFWFGSSLKTQCSSHPSLQHAFDILVRSFMALLPLWFEEWEHEQSGDNNSLVSVRGSVALKCSICFVFVWPNKKSNFFLIEKSKKKNPMRK